MAPPGTSPDLIKILRNALAEITKDPEIKKYAEKVNMPLNLFPADKCLETLNYLFNQPPDILDEFKTYTKY